MNSLDEWASMKQPFELYTEMKTAIFKVMTQIFMVPVNDSTFWTKQDRFGDYMKGLFSVADLPGFAFHKAPKVKISFIYSALHFFSIRNSYLLKSQILPIMMSCAS